MRGLYLVIAVALVAMAQMCVQAGETLTSLEGMQSLSLICDTVEKKAAVNTFKDTFGVELMPAGPNVTDALVAAEKLTLFKDTLKKHSIQYKVLTQNVAKAVEWQFFMEGVMRMMEMPKSLSKKPSFTYYLNYDEICQYLEAIAEEYPDTVTLLNLGTTSEHRPLKGVKLSTGGKNKSSILIDGGIHAREWIAPATVLYILDQLLTNPANQNLLTTVDWYIIPVLNPDGYQFTHSSKIHRLWRKTRSLTAVSSCRGVDANRNFGYGWMVAGASQDPCSDIFAGATAFSEPETRALRDFVLARNGTIKVYLTFHSYGQYILYPWGYTSKPAKNEATLKAVALEASDAIGAVSGTRYTFGQSATHLYPAAGGSDDWVMSTGVNLSYTIELPGGYYGFLLPASEIRNVGRETFEAIKVFHKFA